MIKKTKIHDPFKEREASKYESPIPSREYILQHLKDRGSPATREQLQSELSLTTDDDREALRRRLRAMERDGQLIMNRRGRYGLVDKMDLIPGTVIGHKDGFGFVSPDDNSDDIFISARQMRRVLHGDRVILRISSFDTKGRREGIIIEIIERNTEQVVGQFHRENNIAFVEPSNKRLNQDILIPPGEEDRAQPGQIVVVRITAQPTPRSQPIGRVIEVLGDHMAPGMEIEVALRSYDIPHTWPDTVLQAIKKFPKKVN